MIDMANESVETTDGSIVFINKNHRLMHDLNYRMRVVCMEDYEGVTNCDEYIGFIFGIISSNHDIDKIFIDSILKHADFNISDLPGFLGRLARISEAYGPDFVVSISADKEEIAGFDLSAFEILN